MKFLNHLNFKTIDNTFNTISLAIFITLISLITYNVIANGVINYISINVI